MKAQEECEAQMSLFRSIQPIQKIMFGSLAIV